MWRFAVQPWLTTATWYLKPRRTRIAQVGRRLDQFVIPWEILVKRARRNKGGTSPALIFTHIPKTGGTTLEHLIARNYPPNGLMHVNSKSLHRNPPALFKTSAFPKVVMGHHSLHQVLYRFVDRKVAHITMLREPVSRIISYFHYLKTGENHQLHTRARDMTLRAFVESDLSNELDNGQVMRLSGYQLRDGRRPKVDDQAALIRAIETLTQRFSLFGLTHRYVEFLLMCRRLLGWTELFHEPRNVSSRAPEHESTLDDDVMRTIRERNRADIAFLETAERLFDDRVRELDISAEDARGWTRLNHQYFRLLHPNATANESEAKTKSSRYAVSQ